MPPTLDDLAQLSGVSRATISRVINGGPVSDAMRARVEKVIAETGYRPNSAARSLASGRTGVVGVVMHVEPQVLFRDQYFASLLAGMSDVLATGANGMMLWMGNRSKAETLDDVMRNGLVDGVIVTADYVDDPLVDGLRAGSLTTVLIGHRREDRTASYVDLDNVSAAEGVTRHLLDLGRTRVAHLTGSTGRIVTRDRLLGYRKAMQGAGIHDPALEEEAGFEPPTGRDAMRRLLARTPEVEAVFCVNDFVAMGAMEVLRDAGLRVPQDVAVAGFDDLPLAATLDPPLTTVRQHVPQIGAEAARIMLDLLDDQEPAPRRVLLPTELVVRASTIGGD